MRRFTTLGLAVVMILSLFIAVPVFAENTLSYSVKIENDGGGSLEYLVKIRGQREPNAKVSLTVTDGDGVTVIREQPVSDKSGNFSYEKTFSAAGIYTIYTNSDIGNELKEVSFELKSAEYYQSVIDDIKKAANASELKDKIAENAEQLSLDTKYFTDDKAEEIAEFMIDSLKDMTFSNVSELFDKSVTYAYLSDAENPRKADELIEYYDSYLNIKGQTSPASLFDDYLAFKDSIRSKILTEAFGKIFTVENAADKFNLAVARNAITELSNTETDKFITSHNDYYGFGDYDSYSGNTIRKAQILDKLRKENLGSSKEDLKKAYENAKKVESNTGGSSSSGGVSGGPSVGTVGSTKNFGTESLNKLPEKTAEPTVEFSDIKDVPWAKDAILELARNRVINGKSSGIFAPNDNITREEYAKILSIAFEYYDENAETSFSDVESDGWAYRYIASTQNKGYITGYPDGTFGGGNPITRQDIAVIMYRLMSVNKYIQPTETISNTFIDDDEIDDYAKNAVLMLSNAGIINGMEDGSFAPKKNATRAETCVIVKRALECIREKVETK